VDIDDRVLVRLIEAPGLSEEPEPDLQNLSGTLEILFASRTLSCVLACVPWDAQNDDDYKTIKYYSQLLEPVFSAGNAFAILTNFTKEVFEPLLESNTLAAAKAEKHQAISKYLDTDILECVESQLSKNKFSRTIASCRNGVYKSDVASMSYQVKQRLIKLIETSKPIAILPSYTFNLPQSISALTQKKISDLNVSLNLIEEEHESNFEQIRAHQDAKNTLTLQLHEQEQILHKNSDIQSLPRTLLSSDLLGHLSKADLTCHLFQTFLIPSTQYEFQQLNCWNCTVIHSGQVTGPDMYLVKVIVQPNTLNQTQKTGLDSLKHDQMEDSWVVRFRITWKGKKVNQQKIDETQKKINEIQNEIEKVSSLIEELKLVNIKKSETLLNQQKKQDDLVEFKNFLSKPNFRCNELARLKEVVEGLISRESSWKKASTILSLSGTQVQNPFFRIRVLHEGQLVVNKGIRFKPSLVFEEEFEKIAGNANKIADYIATSENKLITIRPGMSFAEISNIYATYSVTLIKKPTHFHITIVGLEGKKTFDWDETLLIDSLVAKIAKEGGVYEHEYWPTDQHGASVPPGMTLGAFFAATAGSNEMVLHNAGSSSYMDSSDTISSDNVDLLLENFDTQFSQQINLIYQMMHELDGVLDDVEESMIEETVVTAEGGLETARRTVPKITEKLEPPDFDEPQTEKNILLNEQGELRGASFTVLIARLTATKAELQLDIEDFLLTYRSFSKPILLLQALMYRYELTTNKDPEFQKLVHLRYQCPG